MSDASARTIWDIPRHGDFPEDSDKESYCSWGIGSRADELTAAVAFAQMLKLDEIVHAMRAAKQRILKGILDIGTLQFRSFIDPAGDVGNSIIMTLASSDACKQFVEAVRAEGIQGPGGRGEFGASNAFACMSELGLHWYFNNESLVRRKGVYPDGAPWTLAANTFSQGYQYQHGLLPVCDRLAESSAVLAVSACLDDDAIQDVIAAFNKVANMLVEH